MPVSTSRYLRIPKHIRFPFGYTVHIKQITLKELEDRCGASVLGLWEDDIRTIFIGKDLKVARKRWVLLHELIHAWADFQLYCTEIGIAQP